MNNVKLLHIKWFFSNFSIVRWHWKIIKKIWPPKKKLKWRPWIKVWELGTLDQFSPAGCWFRRTRWCYNSLISASSTDPVHGWPGECVPVQPTQFTVVPENVCQFNRPSSQLSRRMCASSTDPVHSCPGECVPVQPTQFTVVPENVCQFNRPSSQLSRRMCSPRFTR